jgi:TPP-dependent pyruvate/acetoin dehydrogenase alpha subunit
MRMGYSRGSRYVAPYYRDMTLVMALGQSVLDILLHAMARRTILQAVGDRCSGISAVVASVLSAAPVQWGAIWFT